MATTVQNPFDTQQASATGGNGIVGSAIQSGSPTAATDTLSTAPAKNMTTSAAPAANTVSGYDPTVRQIDKTTGTVQGQVNSILATDSPLMQRARTLATQQMAGRGLVNSSMNAGAGVAAMTDKAIQIGTPDANAYNTAASENMAAKNTAGQVGATEANKFSLQTGQQKFTAEQNVATQNFSAAQAQLDRAQQTALADKSVEAQKALQVAQQNFTEAQSALDRTQQTNLQTGQQKFASGEAALDRAQQTTIAEKQIQSQKDLQTSQQTFTTAQAALDRAQQTALQDDSQAAQSALATAQQDFQKAQAELDRSQQINMQNDQQAFQEAQIKTEQAFKTAQASLDRTQQSALQDDQQAFTEAMTKSQLPTNFASELSKSTTTSINAIAADANLSGTTDGYIDPATKKFVAGGVPATGYIKGGVFVAGTPPAGYSAVSISASSPKARAIQSTLNYANTQIEWANKFYGSSVPTMAVGP